MIRTLALQEDGKIQFDVPLQQLDNPQFVWYWVDFNDPSMKEIAQFKEHFCFHPLAIDDCLHRLHRPQLEYYDNHHFLILHALQSLTQKPLEVNLFISDTFLVSFHYSTIKEMDYVWQKIVQQPELLTKDYYYPTYKIFDKLVDAYFPLMNEIEEKIEFLESKSNHSSKNLIHQLFRLRNQLSKMRRSVVPMHDLAYRMIHSKRILPNEEQKIHFQNVHDHLIILTKKIESNREITSDIQDNYLSLNSYRMNSIMMTLTVITSIFMPLTFIAGIYGMNFDYMPELKWRYSYFVLIGLMFTLSISLILWFKKKDWLGKD